MIKSELVRRIAGRYPLPSTAVVKKAVDAFFDEISAALAAGKRVEMRGFGSFFIRTWSARRGRNPKTGSWVSAPETRHAALRIGKDSATDLTAWQGAKCDECEDR
jgi:integration host factor subunit beta